MSAGYSGTPLAAKLGITQDDTVIVLGAPDGFAAMLDPLPGGVSLRTRARGRADVVITFHTARADLEQRVPTLLGVLDPDGGMWVAWPKKAAKVPTDITEDTVREVFLPLGLVDNKVCAVDDVWSGLRVVWRRERRAQLRAASAQGEPGPPSSGRTISRGPRSQVK